MCFFQLFFKGGHHPTLFDGLIKVLFDFNFFHHPFSVVSFPLLQYKQGQKISLRKKKSWERLVLTPEPYTCISASLRFFRWPPPPSLNLSLLFILHHWQRLFLSVLWVCWWVSECTGCRSSRWWIVPWRTCPDDSSRRKSEEVFTACLFWVRLSCGAALGFCCWCLLNHCLVELGQEYDRYSCILEHLSVISGHNLWT